MGVGRQNIIILGVKLDYDEFNKKFDFSDFTKYDFSDKKDGIVMVYDGMNGNYVVFGFPIFIGKNDRYEDDGVPFTEIPDFDKEKAKEVEIFSKYELGIEAEAKMYFFSHYH